MLTGLRPTVQAIAALLLAAALGSPSTLSAQKHRNDPAGTSHPAHVLIIRHAEKPPEPSASVDLTPAGLTRAKALVELFTKSAKRPNPFPKPQFIFAARDTKQSHRPRETAEPLGTALGVAVDTRFSDEKVHALARELLSNAKYAGATVLIVWHQGSIPDLASALGAKNAPKKWKDSVFDRVWEITYDEKGNVSFAGLPQRLLDGDSAK